MSNDVKEAINSNNYEVSSSKDMDGSSEENVKELENQSTGTVIKSQSQVPISDVTELQNTLEESVPSENAVSFKVIFNKTKYDVEIPLDRTVRQLKDHLSPIINVLPAMQKVMIKGLAKDDKTLREVGITKGSKVMVVGSKLDDVFNVNTPKVETPPVEKTTTKEPLSKNKMHRKILDKGIPEDAIPGIRDCNDPLPSHPVSGMLNKYGGKVRLTFKLELDQLWIGTKERTEKINMSHIQQVVSEAIEGHEQYHIMALQLGPTEASMYWIYWVPSQYVEAIKNTVLGKW